MNIRFRLEEMGLYRMLNTAFLVCIGLFGMGKYFGIAHPDMLHVLTALVAVSVLTVFYYVSAKGRILCGLGVIGCLSATVLVVGGENCVRFLMSYGNWLFNRPGWQKEWVQGYTIMQVLFLVLICYLLQMVLEKDFRIKLTLSLVLVGALIYCFFKQRELSQAGMVVVVSFLVMVLVEWTQLHWKKEKSKTGQAYMIWMTPFVLMYLVLLLCMPVPEKPYDWQVFKDIYAQLKESLQTITINALSFGREDFDTNLSGFSESGDLGGSVTKEEREIMTIRAGSDLKTNVYLTGKVYNTFDGRQWQQSVEDTSKDRFIDTVTTLYAAQRYDSEYQRDYVYRAKLHICYQYFNSRYLFAPLKAWSLEQLDGPMYFKETDGSLLFEKKAGYGTEYDVIYYQLNMGNDAFYEFLETKQDSDETVLRDILINFKGRTMTEITAEDLEEHKQMVYASNLGNISLSEEAKSYLAQITHDAQTDVEKLRAIEKELSTFTYTLNPGDLPDSVVDESTFLDYFLLQSRQGYCSYFATAFVLLARAEGIPARYVQGYCVPMEVGGEVMVTSDMAHAWPEVYLDGIGWIPFEPTPGYAEIRYTPWAAQKGNQADSTHADYDYVPMNPEWEEEEDVEESPEELTGEDILQETKQDGSVGKILKIFLLSMLCMVAVGLILLWGERRLSRYRYQRMNQEQKYVTEIRRNLKILSWLELVRGEGETMEELQKRIVADLNSAGDLSFLSTYEEFVYGNRGVDSEMIQEARDEQDELLQILKQKKKWTYLYYCLFVKGE